MSNTVWPLSIDTTEIEGGLLNKTGGGNTSIFVDYLCTVFNNGNNFPAFTLLNVPSNTVVATSAAARTNPSRAYADVPVDILELGDVVSMLRDTLRIPLRLKIASTGLYHGAVANLWFQFGILPIIDDLRKVLNFTIAFQKRMEEIKRLASPNGLRRTVAYGIVSGSGTDQMIFQSQGVNYVGTFKVNCKQTIRAHCRWNATPAFGKLSGLQVDRLVRRAIHGLDSFLDPAMLYQAIPWTWLIDYCLNLDLISRLIAILYQRPYHLFG